MVEMKVSQYDDINVGIAQPQLGQAFEQYMAGFLYAIALLHLGTEEGADAGFHQNIAILFLNKKSTATKMNAILFIRRKPALPETFGCVAKHGTAIELLGIAK